MGGCWVDGCWGMDMIWVKVGIMLHGEDVCQDVGYVRTLKTEKGSDYDYNIVCETSIPKFGWFLGIRLVPCASASGVGVGKATHKGHSKHYLHCTSTVVFYTKVDSM